MSQIVCACVCFVFVCCAIAMAKLPYISFSTVEEFYHDKSGAQSIEKAYKFFAEPGYLHNIQSKYIIVKKGHMYNYNVTSF